MENNQIYTHKTINDNGDIVEENCSKYVAHFERSNKNNDFIKAVEWLKKNRNIDLIITIIVKTMGKICKYANIYSTEKDNDGKYKLIRKVNNNGVLENYTMEELEQLVDDLGNNKDEMVR